MIPVECALPGEHLAVPMKDLDGASLLVIVYKIAFRTSRSGVVSVDEETPPTPCLADECYEEYSRRPEQPGDAESSIRRPSDLVAYKPGTDVLLVGNAYPSNQPHTDVSLRMGPLHKVVRAHGLRVLQAGSFGGLSAGPARPLREPLPLRWELAYGGIDRSDPEKPAQEPRNPLGRGYSRSPKSVIGQPAPQLEDPAHPFGSSDGGPACFGAIHRHWQPRVSFAGTYDTSWMETRMPLLPLDFDDRYHVTAPSDQWSLRPLLGDEPIEVVGATAEPSWHVRLPRVSPRFRAQCEGLWQDLPTHLDTVLIEPDRRRVELTFRASVVLPPKWERLQAAEIHGELA